MKLRFVFLSAVVAAAALAACGGGGGGGGTPPTSPPSSTPTGPVSSSVTLGGATSVALPANSSGITGNLRLPAGSGSATLTYGIPVASAPTPLPGVATSAVRRSADSATSNAVLLYVSFTATSSVTLSGVPGFTATLPSGAAPSGSQFFVAYYGQQSGQAPTSQSAAWVSDSSTGATASGSSLTVPATTTPTFTLSAGQSIYFTLYYGYYIPPINILGCVGVQPALAQRQLVGVTPVTNNSTWAYTGTLTQSIVRSSPCPIPTPAIPATATVTVDVSVTAAPPGAPGGSLDEHSVETDAFATNTTQVITDAIVNPTSEIESSETSVDLTGNSVLTTFGNGGLTYNAAATNNPPSTVNTTFADGTTYARTYSGTAGAYTETDLLAGLSNYPTTIAVNADGSANYTFTTIDPNSGTKGTQATTMSAPAGGMITVVFGDNAPASIPAWFTSGPLYSDVTVASGNQTIDARCLGTALGGTSGNQFVRTINVIDPALGYTDTRTVTSYVVVSYQSTGETVGPVCVVISDTQNLYYDFLLDEPFGLFYSSDGKPLQMSTVSEVYYFSAAPIGELRGRNAAQSAAMAANLALRVSAIPFERTIEHAQRLEQFEKVANQKHLGGVR